MKCIQWDVDSLDWKDTATVDSIVTRVTGKVKNGSIVLFHNAALHTPEALPAIIEQLKGIRCHSTLRQRGTNKNIKVLSCPDAIGRVLEKVAKMRKEEISCKHVDMPATEAACHSEDCVSCAECSSCRADDDLGAQLHGSPCPECGGAMEHEGGCVVCRGCGYSKCG